MTIVDSMLADPFFEQPHPKSTDTPTMLAIYQRARSANAGASLSLDDELATAAEIVARSILRAIQAIEQKGGATSDELIISGGGVNNRAIMQSLRNGIPSSCT